MSVWCLDWKKQRWKLVGYQEKWAKSGALGNTTGRLGKGITYGYFKKVQFDKTWLGIAQGWNDSFTKKFDLKKEEKMCPMKTEDWVKTFLL